MKKLIIGAMALVLVAIPAASQSLDDLNIQIHGYATQGFLYTSQNNIFTTSSSNGSPAWDETVVNLSAQPSPKLRVGVQARYFLLGNLGNAITLDWAQADYRANDKFGVRFGKVKTPSGLFNEFQDIDPGYIWALLPQSIYPLMSRNSLLSHYGGVVYGTLKLGKKAGKLEYRGWGGERILSSDDGYNLAEAESGITLPNGIGGITEGAAIHWRTPLSGLMIGASNSHDFQWNAVINQTITGFGTFNGTEVVHSFNVPQVFAKYEKNKVMVAGEYSRLPVAGAFQVPEVYTTPFRIDERGWYGMASYMVTEKLTAGVYDSQLVDHQAALGPGRYSKDWAISGEYNFNQFLYTKMEEHFIDGTLSDFDTTLNPNGLKNSTKMTILKLGVSF